MAESKKIKKVPPREKKKKNSMNDSYEGSSDESTGKEKICDEEGFFDDEDRDNLMKMTQITREKLIFDRIQQRDSILKARKLEKELNKKNDEFQIKKLDKSKTAKDKALDEIVLKKNKEKEKSKKIKDEGEIKNSSEIESEDSNEENHYNSIPDEDSKKKTESKNLRHHEKSPSKIVEDKIDEKDLEKIRLTRSFLEKMIPNSFFEKTVKGCFVKIRISAENMNKSSGNYAIAEIIDVLETNEPYKIEERETKKILLLKHADRERKFKINFVSNSKFGTDEFCNWIEKMVLNKLPLPTMSHIHSKINDIKQALNYKYKSSELQDLIKKNVDKKINLNEKELKDLTPEITFLETRLGNIEYDYYTTKKPELLIEINQINEKLEILKEKNAKYHEEKKNKKKKEILGNIVHKQNIKKKEKNNKNVKLDEKNGFKKTRNTKNFEELLANCNNARDYEELKENFLKNFTKNFSFEEEISNWIVDETEII